MWSFLPTKLKMEKNWDHFKLQFKAFLKRDQACSHELSGVYGVYFYCIIVLYCSVCFPIELYGFEQSRGPSRDRCCKLA